MKRFVEYMGWSSQPWTNASEGQEGRFFFQGTAPDRLQRRDFGGNTGEASGWPKSCGSGREAKRLSQVLWAASGFRSDFKRHSGPPWPATKAAI